MAIQTINVLLTSFPGLDLPSTLSLPLPADTSINDLTSTVASHLPERALSQTLILTTNSNCGLNPACTLPITALLPRSDSQCDLLPLRLTTRLCGGKGGFGSQLRAQGGRMQSRKKQSGPASSNRALGGPRYRVIAEAKALAEYYATQPERERKEREERRKKLEGVIEKAEKMEEEVRSGKRGNGKGRLDGKWVEAKEESEEKVREALRKAMAGEGKEGSDVSAEASSEGSSESEEDDAEEAVTSSSKDAQSRTFFGWDEDEEMDSDEDDEDEIHADGPPVVEMSEGKGKAKA